jgi:hypothetical protein
MLLPAHAEVSPARISGDSLDQSTRAAVRFLLAAQRKAGNFNGKWQNEGGFTDTHEPQVQAQCLWSLAFANRLRPDDKTRDAVRRGIQFFVINSRELSSSRLVVTHPFGKFSDTATVAFVALALDELVRTRDAVSTTERATYLVTMQQYANFLLTMQTASGRYHFRYHQQSGLPQPGPVPRTDGIVLLALTRIAALLNSEQLKAHLGRSFKQVLAATVNAKPSPDADPNAPYRFCEFGLQALADFADFTNNGAWQRECVRISGLMAAAMPDPEQRFTRIMHLAGLAAAWPLVEQLGNANTTRQFTFRLQEELGILLRHQIAGPEPLKELPVWTAAAGALAESTDAAEISIQPTAELLAAALTYRANLFPQSKSP